MSTIINDIISTIPRIENRPYALVLWIFNCICPGFGTILGACSNNCNCVQIIVGIAQLFPLSGIVGWILSIYWGYRMYYDFLIYCETQEITKRNFPSPKQKFAEVTITKGNLEN